MIQFKKCIFFIILLGFCLPLALPFLKKGFFISHDGEWAVVRLSAFHRALADGQLPPRWAGSLFHSYGYPIFNFNYPGPYIIGEAFHLLGLGFVDSIKAVFVLSIILSGVAMFLLLREIYDPGIALAGSIIYLYFPFRMVDLFIRASPGESLVFAILPLVFLGLLKLKSHQRRWLVFTALSIAFLILSHNSLALACLPIIILFIAIDKKIRLSGLVAVGLAFGATAFFWLPAMAEKHLTLLSSGNLTKPIDHFPTIKSLLIPSWGLSFQIGPVHLLLFFLSLAVLTRKKNTYILFFSLAAFANIFFLLPVSTFFWQHLPLVVYMSYPWRLLVPLGFYLSVVSLYPKNKLLLIASIGLLYFLSINYRPVNYIDRGEMFYITNQSTTIQGDENTPLWVKTPPTSKPKDKIEIDGEYQVDTLKSNLLTARVKTAKSQRIFINTIYYPGWTAEVNGQVQGINFDNDKGVISLEIPEGESMIRLVFGETWLRLFADYFSLASLVVLGILLI